MPTATTGPGTQAATQNSSSGKLAAFLKKFTVILGAPRELWLVFAIKLVGVAAYGINNSTLKLWLSSDLGYSDRKALGLVAAWSFTMTGITLLVGSLTDAVGFRKTFFLGVWVCIVGRAVMAFTGLKWLALAGGLFPLAIGEALGSPVLVAAVRKYSNTKQRSIAYSIIYAVMNAGFLIASFVFDYVREGLGEHGQVHLLGFSFSTYRVLLLLALALEISLLPLVYFLRKGLEVTDDGIRIIPEQPKYTGQSFLNSFWFTLRDSARDTWRLFAGLLRQSSFARLIAFLMLIAFLKLIFMQMYYVFPTFGIRELGDGAPVGKLWAINSILIIPLALIVGALVQRFSAYGLVIVGGVISAASVFIMALPTEWFGPLTDNQVMHWIALHYLGLKGTVHPYYPMIILFIILLSVGEAFYSPRVYEYAAAIAPKGQEASYSSLSYVPFLLAKILVGTLSGGLLAAYCPEQGTRHSGTMWLVVALTASVAPVGLLIFRRYIRVHEVGRQD
ncbi:MAG: MFS transporter [Verrucomicrobia bacterium]|nr:MAG: MFS transporter [Verrucomicrobiota bacterium]